MSTTYKPTSRKGKLKKNLISFLNEDDELPIEAGKVFQALRKSNKIKKGNLINK
jgi:hypothetical protein